MRRRGTVVLFLVALTLVAYYALVERPRTNSPADDSLITLDPDAVERVTIQRGDETVVLTRVDTHWEIDTPVHDLADAAAVMRLLAALATAKVAGNIGAQQDMAPYGLDAPITIAADTPGVGTASVRIGGYTVDRALVYAMRAGGGDVVLAPTTLRRYAQAAVEDFRYKRVATFDISLVDSFRVTSPARIMSWYRSGSGWYTTAGGDTIDGNTTAVEGILRRVRGLRVVGFPSRIEPFGGMNHPSLTVYRTQPNQPQRLEFAPYLSSFVVAIQPEDRQVLVDSSAMDVFGFDVEQLRERHMLRFDPTHVARIELETSETIATILRTRGGWAVPNPAMGNLNGDLVRAALSASRALEFDRVRAERVVPPPEIADATFRLALFDSGGTILDELVCRLEPGDSVAVATSRSSGLQVGIAASTLRRLEERFQRIRTQ